MLGPREDDATREIARRLQAKLAVSPLLARILAVRGLTTEGEARAFLDPRLDHLHDPFLMADCDRAVARLRRAIHAREPLLVYGDYDVDGLTSLAILVHFLRLAGCQVHTYVPNRTREDYSLNRGGLDAIRQYGARVVITTDSGTGSHDAIAALARDGVDVIVTDHHEPENSLPPALAVLNPRRADCSYPFKSLCGAGVAFKLVSALVERTRRNSQEAERFERFFLDALAWTAMGTIADLVPLVGENRALVAFGLRALGATEQPGLRALRVVSRLGRKAVSTRDVAFSLAPRLNAAGRMGKVEDAVRLLVADDPVRARDAARALDSLNRARRTLQARILGEAREGISGSAGAPVLLVWGKEWPTGVLGLVAGSLSRESGKPCLVASVQGPRARGSGRAPLGAPILPVLRRNRDLLGAFGGHARAAGFELPAGNLPRLAERLRAERCDVSPTASLRAPDLRVGLRELTVPAIRELRRLEPHGEGNPAPWFEARGVRLGGRPTRVPSRPGRWSLWAADGGVGHRVLIRGPDLSRVPIDAPVDLCFEARLDPGEDRGELEVVSLGRRSEAEVAW